MTEGLGEITVCYAMTFNRHSKHSAARLWAAITNADEVSKWMDYPATIDLRPGGRWTIDFTRTDDDVLDGVIIRVEPERILAYAWGRSVVEWAIDETSDGCTYTFVHQGLPDRGEGEEGLIAGWHEFLDRLDLHLEGRYISEPEQKARWNQLKPPYRERLESAIR